MNIKRLYSLLIVLLVACAPYAFGQGWPLPADQANTPVACGARCSSGGSTVGYVDPFVGFAGRYLDSTDTGNCQQTWKTGRARQFTLSPETNRLYMIMGQGIAVYDLNNFFNRLEQKEALTNARSVGVRPLNFRQGCNTRDSNPEVFLQWDKWFYAENTSSWVAPVTDGQDRIFGYDVDDRGFVYLGYSLYGWGIVKDDMKNDGNLMQSFYQQTSIPANAVAPYFPIVTKTSAGRYLMMITGEGDTKFDVYDVTDASNPTRIQSVPRGMSGSYGGWARTPARDRFAIVGTDTDLNFYTNDGVATNAYIGHFADAVYTSVTTDGTNFYATSKSPAAITIFRPSGNTYVPQRYAIATDDPFFTPSLIRYGGGYLTVEGGTGTGSRDVRLYRVDASGPTEVSLGVPQAPGVGYLRAYYNQAPAGFVGPGSYTHTVDTRVVTANGKSYFMVAAYGLGDVYKFRGGDTITVTNNGAAGSSNANAPARPAKAIFPGDRVSFVATAGSGGATAVTWNFGNPEANGDPNTATSNTGTVVTHQYTGITTQTLGNTRNVTASTGSINGASTITLTPPAARFGVVNSLGQRIGALVTKPDATASTPIVVGDKFYDGSDGDVEGHLATFAIDNGSTTVVPYSASSPSLYQVSVGTCSATAHALNFDAHYGAINGQAVVQPEYTAGIHGFTYRVRPFAGWIDAPSAGNTALTFTGNYRATTDTTVLTSAQAAALTYAWALVDANNNVVVAGPTGGVANGIVQWAVPKTSITTRGLRVRFNITSPTSVLGSCAGQGLETASAFSNPLNVPDPVVNGGCTNGGAPCNFTVGSVSGVDQVSDGWSYSWTVAPNTGVVAGAAAGPTFSPTFTQVGTYTVTVVATNAIGAQQASLSVPVTVAAPLCPVLAPNTLFASFSGGSSGCTPATIGGCNSGESITFDVFKMSQAYDFDCQPHTYSWNFGDGATSTSKTAVHAYSTAGNYTATCTVTAGGVSQQFTATVKIGGAAQPTPTPTVPTPTVPTPTTPTPGGCPVLTAAALFATFSGGTSGCTPVTIAGCSAGESISFDLFKADPAYSLECAVHNYSWSFGDGSAPASGKTVAHTYTTNGNFTVSCTVTVNGISQHYDAIVKITGAQAPTPGPVTPGPVTPGPVTPGPVTPGSCGTMTNNSVYVSFVGAASGCTPVFGSCARNEQVAFTATDSLLYRFSCAGTHTFAWEFGDGSTGSGQTVTHLYGAPGTYTAKVTITPPSGTPFVAQTSVVVSGGGTDNPGNPGLPVDSWDFTIAPYYLGGTHVPNGWVLQPYVAPDGAISTWNWDFGDGRKQTATNTLPLVVVYTDNKDDHTITLTTSAGVKTHKTSTVRRRPGR